ncbi:MAG: two-component system sensor histidine kinase/response regulator [Flavobacterium sp.]|jgi:two-component system sensor histidine kinase/response regulator
MNGHIEVISEEGVCTCFTFNIALGTSPQSQLLAPKTPFSAAKILVIDDNSMNRAVVQSQLSHWGADVSEAESGRHALEILADTRSRDQFETVILDMAMPDMNGADLGRIIRDNPDYNDLKLVMMTSVSTQGDAKYFADIGFSAYFPKPATVKDLI